MKRTKYIFPLSFGRSLKEMVYVVECYLQRNEAMQTQQVPCDENNHIVLQARAKLGNLKQLIGMDKVLTVHLSETESKEVCVEFSNAKWADKGTVMLISMIVLWPLTVTSGVGMYKQGKLPKKILCAIEEYIGKKPRIERS